MNLTEKHLAAIRKDPKAFLDRGRHVRERIRTKQRRIESWRGFAESITVTLSPVAASSSLPSKRTEKAVCNIMELQEDIRQEIRELAEVEREISAALKLIPEDEANLAWVLELRYLSNLSFEEAAREMNYSFRWVQKLHSLALDKLKESA